MPSRPHAHEWNKIVDAAFDLDKAEPFLSQMAETEPVQKDRGAVPKALYEGQPRAGHGQFGTGKFANSKGMEGMSGMMANISKPDGGFTYHAVTGHQPTTGYALSIYKGHEKVLDAKTMTPKDLVKFAMANRDLLSQKDNFFGAWHNPADGKVYLDISKVVGNPQQAERLGRANNQLAYFDLAGGKSVDISAGKSSAT